MKRIISMFLIFTLLVTGTSIVVAEDTEQSNWSVSSINELKSYNQFRDEAFNNYTSPITRLDFIYLAVKVYELLDGKEIVIDTSISFTDTTDIYAIKGATVGITSGVGNNKFGASELLTREQLATFMIRVLTLLDLDINEMSIDKFDDDSVISTWAKEAVYLAKSNNIISGIGNNNVGPKDNATTEMALVISNRILKTNGYIPNENVVEDTSEAAEMNIGDYVQFGKYNDAPVLWRVIHKDENGNPLLFAEKAISYKAYDASGAAYSNYSRSNLGSNEWETSTIRRWLNSNKMSVDWIDNEPSLENVSHGNPYNKEPGFLTQNNFSTAEVNAILPVNHNVLLKDIDSIKNDSGSEYIKYGQYGESFINNNANAYKRNLTDSVFLLSMEEHYNYVSRNNLSVEATPTPEMMTMSDYIPHYVSLDKNVEYWLRTPSYHSNSSYQVYKCQNPDSAGAGYVYGSSGIRPAMYIENTKFTVLNDGGSLENPYVVQAKKSNIPQLLAYDFSTKRTFVTLEKNASEDIILSTNDSSISIEFLSQDTTIATVTDNGTITAKEYGATSIDVTVTQDGYLPTTQKIIVYVKEPGINIDNYVYYGSYNGEPILWKVIDIDNNGNPLLLSYYVISFKTFDTYSNDDSSIKETYVKGKSWHDSTLRQWLNASGMITWNQTPPSALNISDGNNPYDQESGFLSSEHFSSSELSNIIPTSHIGENTTDKMFLLSSSEANKYLSDRDILPFAKPTAEAVELETSDSYWISPAFGIDYWLRSSLEMNRIDSVKLDNFGHQAYSTTKSNNGTVGVRPTFRLDLSQATLLDGAGYNNYPYYVDFD